jgi:hypothetical protein
MGNVDFDLRQATITQIQANVGTMTQHWLALLGVGTCDKRRQDSSNPVPDVVMPQAAEASTSPTRMDVLTSAAKALAALPWAGQASGEHDCSQPQLETQTKLVIEKGRERVPWGGQ